MRIATLMASALLATALTGCPAPASPTPVLTLKVDPNPKHNVGTTAQLRLQLDSGADSKTGQPMLGALIEKRRSATQWFADPKDAVAFVTSTAQVKFLKDGPVKIWATFKQDEKVLRSNVIELEIGN